MEIDSDRKFILSLHRAMKELTPVNNADSRMVEQ